jgi:hypothetical protein
MRYDRSDPLALLRVFSRVLARVNNRMLTSRPFGMLALPTNRAFAGSSRWAVKDSNLRPWD